MDTPIILIHGLAGIAGTSFIHLSLYPLKKYLEYYNHKNVYIIKYPSDYLTIENSLEYVSQEILKVTNKETEIIIVGQSMGGVIAFNLHNLGWKIKMAISVGSPLNGARLITQIENVIKKNTPKSIYDLTVWLLKTQGHIELQKEMKQKTPPHKYKTISLGWCNSNFDGCVYKDEAIISEENNIHLCWADHRTIFLNPRLWFQIHDLIMN